MSNPTDFALPSEVYAMMQQLHDAETPQLPVAAADAVHLRIDALEQRMLDTGEAIDLPLVHRFLPGMYVREIHMPAGSLCTSKIHRTEHPYVVLQGEVSVFIPGEEVVHLSAGHIGVTKAGTRRVLYNHTDVVWVTFHANPDDEDLETIEQRIIEPRVREDGMTVYELWQRQLAAKAALERSSEDAIQDDGNVMQVTGDTL